MPSDPNTWPQFPGFPAESSAHAPTPRQTDPRAGTLHPAISRADQERSAGAGNRNAFGPPAGGWPTAMPTMPTLPTLPNVQPAEGLSPLKARVVAGVGQIAETFGGRFGPNLAMLLGAAQALMTANIGKTTDEQVEGDLLRFERLCHEWRTGEVLPDPAA